MKLLFVLFSIASSFASTEVSYVDYQVPHACKNINLSEAADVLGGDCQAMGMTLASYKVSSCEPNGDDGGYVNYFAVTVVGQCQNPSFIKTKFEAANSCVMPGLMCRDIMDICCTTGGFCGGTLMCQ